MNQLKVLLSGALLFIFCLAFFPNSALAQDFEKQFDLNSWSKLISKNQSFRASVTQQKEVYGVLVPIGAGTIYNTPKATVYYQKLPIDLWFVALAKSLKYQVAGAEIKHLTSKDNNQIFNIIQATKALIAGNNKSLRRHFDYELKGDHNYWELSLTPKSIKFKAMYHTIKLTGDEFIKTIKLISSQNKVTLITIFAHQTENLKLTETESYLLSLLEQ